MKPVGKRRRRASEIPASSNARKASGWRSEKTSRLPAAYSADLRACAGRARDLAALDEGEVGEGGDYGVLKMLDCALES